MHIYYKGALSVFIYLHNVKENIMVSDIRTSSETCLHHRTYGSTSDGGLGTVSRGKDRHVYGILQHVQRRHHLRAKVELKR